MGQGHVIVVEDDDALRSSLCSLLAFEGFDVTCWSNARSLLDHMPNDAPVVVVTDMRMPGMTGLEMHRAMLEVSRPLPVVYISGESTTQEVVESMKYRPVDFLLKPFSRDDLLRAVRQGLEHDRQTVRRLNDEARAKAALEQLSPREREVFHLLAKGYNNAEITAQLFIALPTAKQYKAEVMRKLGLRSLSELLELSQHAPDPS